jgi:hypothetical protein
MNNETKLNFEEAKMEIVAFDVEDVICTSFDGDIDVVNE